MLVQGDQVPEIQTKPYRAVNRPGENMGESLE